MDPIANLQAEHVVALEKLDALESVIKTLERGGSPEAVATVSDVIAFLNAELELHIRKEEEALFPPLDVMIGSGLGPTAVMRMEHNDLKARRDALKAALDRKIATEMAPPAGEIIGILREHIEKEEYVLFPLTRSALSPEQLQAIGAEFAAIEEAAAAHPRTATAR
ncbi:MAG: hemerythrin domain-containing protein [Deltaproteobacteria bacterium]|nr:hemerythrin domain-containing protein [Deltaproteobacteria bacterium]